MWYFQKNTDLNLVFHEKIHFSITKYHFISSKNDLINFEKNMPLSSFINKL